MISREVAGNLQCSRIQGLVNEAREFWMTASRWLHSPWVGDHCQGLLYTVSIVASQLDLRKSYDLILKPPKLVSRTGQSVGVWKRVVGSVKYGGFALVLSYFRCHVLGSWCFQNSAILVRRLEKAYQPMCTLSYHSCLWLGLVGLNSISLDFSGLGTLTNPFLTWDLGLESSFIGLTWTEWGMKPWMPQTSVHMRGDNMRSLSVYCWKHRRNPNPKPVLLYFLML